MLRLAACILVVIGFPAAAQAPVAESPRATPFTHLGAPRAIALSAEAPTANVNFGARGDELVTRGAFRLRYMLPPGAARLRLALNDQPIGELAPAAGERPGEPAERVVPFDPRLVVGFNRLTLTLVGGEGVAAQVAGTSALEIVVRPLALADDLALWPEPFFDRHDQRLVELPFAFAARPSLEALRAGAIVASRLGALAAWRGARFPASFGAPVPGHAIAFATNADRPGFLAALAPVEGPTLRMMANPADPTRKVLVVMGRDGADLVAAARGLVATDARRSGPIATVAAAEPAPRAAWDAPAIVRVDRPVRLSELVDEPRALELGGTTAAPTPVRLELRVPPELAAVDLPGVPLQLNVRYTPPACADEARLEASIDGELVQVRTLEAAPRALVDSRVLYLPAARLRSRVEVAIALRYLMKSEGACRDAPPEPMRAAIAPESTIDLSGLTRLARLPDLEAFARLGYPFTRHADLAQTVVVMPTEFGPADAEVLLALAGRMGEATGAAATRVRLATPDDEAALREADLLVIGSPSRQRLVDRWQASMPAPLPGRTRGPLPVKYEGAGPVATILGFESPLTPGRSVVLLTAIVPEQVPRAVQALEDDEMGKAVGGSVAYVFSGRVESALAGPTYVVGFAPTVDGVREWIVERPAVLAALAGVALAILLGLAWALARAMRRWSAAA